MTPEAEVEEEGNFGADLRHSISSSSMYSPLPFRLSEADAGFLDFFFAPPLGLLPAYSSEEFRAS